MRVLFVDDESRILAGIERELFMRDCEWECQFVTSGKDALASMESEPVDVVVSDMRMPGMDGAELLTQVQQRWPETIRFILSGYSDTGEAMRALDVAHQFLSKPCDNNTLIAKVERAISLRKMLQNPDLLEQVGRIGHLPAAPRVYVKLTRKMADPTSDMADLAAIIASDPALTAKLLQLANSAYFNAVATVNSVSEAVARLGLNTVRKLALACETYGAGQHNGDIEALQARALLASNLAERIATESKWRDPAATAALLAEIGLLLPGVCDDRNGDENHVHHNLCHHAEIGAYLLGLWDLPLEIVEAVALHCDPQRLPGTDFDVVGVVHVAVALACGKDADFEFLERTGHLDRWSHWQELRDKLNRRAA